MVAQCKPDAIKRDAKEGLNPDMSIFDFSNSAANKDMIAEIWTNGDTII